MRRRLCLLTVLGVAIFAALAKPSFSQVGASVAQLNGSVRDESGGTVAKATITARETETNRTYTAVSNENGLYVLASLPPGRYELTTEASGFAKSTQTGIVLTVGQAATIDVTVKVASSAEKVEVTTETPPVEPTRTEVSQVIDTQQIQSLPISGRLFTDFVLLTPGGTTDLHGSIYDYIENNALNARNLLQHGTLPVSGTTVPNTLRQNQFGGTLGGPIKKDKTFFFLNYEGQRRGEAAVQSPTLLQNFTLINQAKALLGIAPEQESTLKTYDSDKGFAKLDHQINKDNRLTLRYSIEDARILNVLVGDTLDGGGLAASSSGHNNFLRDQALVGTVSSQLKPSLVNTALAQYARRHSTYPGVTGQPNLDLPNEVMMGHNFGVFDATYESRGQFADSLYWVKGSHLVKFGVDYNRINDHIIWPGFSPMRIVLPGVNCLVDFANYVQSVRTGLPAGDSSYVASNPGEGPCPLALGSGLPPFPATPGPNPADPSNGVPVVFWPSPLGSADNSVVDGTAATAPPFPLP